MKLSTGSYSRGRVGTIVGFIVMAIILGATGGDVGYELICGAGIVTWIAVTWFLNANKDKEIL